MTEVSKAALSVRQATRGDAALMREILAPIIAAGGTTALEELPSETEINEWFVTGTHCLACTVADDFVGRMAGFQALSLHANLPRKWADIATFARPYPRPSGVGEALFLNTLEQAARTGIHHINATIRADNLVGLAYYARIGFESYDVTRSVPLADGTPVDRIHKRFSL